MTPLQKYCWEQNVGSENPACFACFCLCASRFLSLTCSMHVLSAYPTDQFGSLGCLLDVRTVGHRGVVEVGFGVLLVGNLWSRQNTVWWTQTTNVSHVYPNVEMKINTTHAALTLGHGHSMLNIRWNHHVVIH